MRHLPKKETSIAAIACLVLLCSLGVFVFMGKYIEHKQAELYAVRVETEKAREGKLQLDSLKRIVIDTRATRDTLKNFIVADQGVVAFLAELEKVAEGNGVKPETRSIATTPIAKQKRFEELRITFGLAGSLVDVQNTIKTLEYMPYQMHIERATVRSGVGKDDAVADLVLVVTKALPSQ
jgi:hypothetical protein